MGPAARATPPEAGQTCRSYVGDDRSGRGAAIGTGYRAGGREGWTERAPAVLQTPIHTARVLRPEARHAGRDVGADPTIDARVTQTGTTVAVRVLRTAGKLTGRTGERNRSGRPAAVAESADGGQPSRRVASPLRSHAPAGRQRPAGAVSPARSGGGGRSPGPGARRDRARPRIPQPARPPRRSPSPPGRWRTAPSSPPGSA